MSAIGCICRSIHSLAVLIRKACTKKKMSAMQSEKDKDEIAYIVEYAKELDSYKTSLIADHEPAEVD